MFRFSKTVLVGLIALAPLQTFADSRYFNRYSTRLTPEDYLMGSHGERKDDIFERSRAIDLGVNLNIGSDCGRIDFAGTLRSTLKNMLDSRYFGDLGRNIVAGSPMLLACYMSPTWCAILKHTQINANLLSQARLNQCSIIDKYTDSRVEDFYRGRQDCVRKQIDANGGDLENALQHCQNTFDIDLANWAGGGGKTGTNRLIQSSARWAKMDGSESKGTLDLLKSMVGDTVINRGEVSVEYGPRSMALTPRAYLMGLENDSYDRLCKNYMQKVDSSLSTESLDKVISAKQLRDLDPNGQDTFVDRQTLETLSALPLARRQVACRKLSDAIALTVYTRDMNRSLDMITTLTQNPNLPPNRKEELEQKRKALKEQVEMSLDLRREKNEPLNRVLAQINEEGQRSRSEWMGEMLTNDAINHQQDQGNASMRDCADGVFCD